MNIHIHKSGAELGRAAGAEAARLIRKTIAQNGNANIILATGASQFATLEQLVAEKNIDWSKVTMFHLDEYIGLPVTHPASFRKYLQERFLLKLPPMQAVFLIDGERVAQEECLRLNNAINKHPVDIALVGIGENGHLAFNDPPADFNTALPYIEVTLDMDCRKQQLGEGWFGSLEEVPLQAISMSVQQIMKSKHIICSVPDSRKAVAVKNTVMLPVSTLCPASILQKHPSCELYLDSAAAALLT